MALDQSGDLILKTKLGSMRQERPIIYQWVSGVKKAVAGGYRLKDNQTVVFELGEYDEHLPLIIDPILGFATFLGGAGADLG